MRIIRHDQKNYASAIKKLNRRATPPAGVEKIVADVIANVEKNGDKALIDAMAASLSTGANGCTKEDDSQESVLSASLLEPLWP